MGVIKHMAAFLSTLPPLCRVSYLPLLHDILHSTNPFNWRLRQSLAAQLPQLIMLPAKQDLYQTLFPLILILLQDPVASVRVDSFPGVSALILNLYDLARGLMVTDLDATTQTTDNSAIINMSKHYLENVARSINSFAVGAKYQLRQLWIELCHRLLYDLPKELFERYFIAKILQLTCDRVTNVRVTMACFLAGWDTGGGAIHSNVTAAGPRRTSTSVDSTHSRSSSSSKAGAGGASSSVPSTPVNSRASSVDVSGGIGDATYLIVENESMKNFPSEKVTTDLREAIALEQSNGDNSKAMAGTSPAGDESDGVNLAALAGVEQTPYAWLLLRKDIQMCIDRLSVDDIDVYLNMVKLQPAFSRFNFKSISCRGMGVAPGGNDPIAMNPSAAPLLWGSSSSEEALSGSIHSEAGFFSSSSSVSDEMANSQFSDSGTSSSTMITANASASAGNRGHTSSGGGAVIAETAPEKRRLRSTSTELPLPTAPSAGSSTAAAGSLGLFMPPAVPSPHESTSSVDGRDEDLSPPPIRQAPSSSHENRTSFLEMQMEMDKIDGIFPQSSSPATSLSSPSHAPHLMMPDAQQSALETLLSEDMDITHVDISAIDISAAKEIMTRHRPAVTMLEFEDDNDALQHSSAIGAPPPMQIDSLTETITASNSGLAAATADGDRVQATDTDDRPVGLAENTLSPPVLDNREVPKTLSEFVDSVDLS
jgi:hypothetical protein